MSKLQGQRRSEARGGGLNVSDTKPEYDRYGNEIDGEFLYCSFPDCGCDGARLCMAKNGPSWCALTLNLEKGSLR